MDPVWGFIHNTTGFEPSQGTVDFSAGLGDSLLFGFGDDLRELWGIDGGINRCSGYYKAGEYTSLVFGSIGTGRAFYVEGSKLLSLTKNPKILEYGSNIRNFSKRYMGPAVVPHPYFIRNYRSRIKPWAEHVANKGFDEARKGLGRTDPTFNKLIPLAQGQGARFNDPVKDNGDPCGCY